MPPTRLRLSSSERGSRAEERIGFGSAGGRVESAAPVERRRAQAQRVVPPGGITLGSSNDIALSDVFTFTASGGGGFAFNWSSPAAWQDVDGQITEPGVYYFQLYHASGSGNPGEYLFVSNSVENLSLFIPADVISEVREFPIGTRAYGESDLPGNDNDWFFSNWTSYDWTGQLWVARLAW